MTSCSFNWRILHGNWDYPIIGIIPKDTKIEDIQEFFQIEVMTSSENNTLLLVGIKKDIYLRSMDRLKDWKPKMLPWLNHGGLLHVSRKNQSIFLEDYPLHKWIVALVMTGLPIQKSRLKLQFRSSFPKWGDHPLVFL